MLFLTIKVFLFQAEVLLIIFLFCRKLFIVLIRCTKEKKFMILKIDLKKAYDRIKWSFIRDMLILLNITNHIWELIRRYISSASVSINWNGEPTSSLNSSRGLR
jgi:hypothetical protein